jgi:membrane protease YdiL (CAAX protease family)
LQTPGDSPRRRDALLLAIGFEGGLVLLAWLLGWVLEQPPLAKTHWNTRDLGLSVAATLPLLVGFAICVRWPIGPLARIKRFSDEFIRPFFRPCTWYDLAVISVVAGLGEEMLFRGVVQGALGSWLGTGYGLAITSVVFGLLHCITPTYALLATLCGAYLGGLLLLTDNLLAAIVPHALYDFIALTYLVRGPAPKDAELAGRPPEL